MTRSPRLLYTVLPCVLLLIACQPEYRLRFPERPAEHPGGPAGA